MAQPDCSVPALAAMPYVPAGHGAGTAAPMGQYDPMGHSLPAGVDVVLCAGQAQPAAHGLHLSDITVANWPAGHGIGDVAVVGHSKPAGQLTQPEAVA